MKTLYLDCSMGAAGDMLTAALLELHPDPAGFLERLNRAGIPSVSVSAAKTIKHGVTGTHVGVAVGGHEEETEPAPAGHHAHHRSMKEIETLVSGLSLPKPVKEDVMAVYRLLAEAESSVHGESVAEIHFHEVGALDAIADIAAVSLLLHELAPARVVASPVCVGGGTVLCAHGELPVPTPATALLLRGIPAFGGTVRGELCTPTGAALLKRFASSFEPMPLMRIEKIGYGMGGRDFGTASCVRAFWGETENGENSVLELCCNLDDMTPEAVAFAEERLLDAGVLEVYTTPVQMKKNRPGILLSCLCREEQKEEMLKLIFRHTTTIGVRQTVWQRSTLSRSEHLVQTDYGPIRVKRAEGWGVQREKAEYDDLARIARERGLSLEDARQLMERAEGKK